jgi:circadian clock protein KaiC
VVIVDPVSNLTAMGNNTDVNSLLVRLIDYLKTLKVTTFFTSLTSGGAAVEATEVGISSLIDTWLLVRDLETSGERNRGLYVLKSRGMAHSNQIREFLLTRKGIDLVDVYQGAEGVLTGSQRLAQENRERASAVTLEQEIQAQELEVVRKRKAMDARIAALQAELASEEESLRRAIQLKKTQQDRLRNERRLMAEKRQADAENNGQRLAKEGTFHG